MKVINIHKRVITQPIHEIALLFKTLATDNDQMLATDKWPAMTGFNGYHKFELSALKPDGTELSHTIDMTTTGFASIKWLFAIRWLHDAYIEDAFDKVENHFTKDKKKSEWSWWVKTLRKIMKPKKK